LLSFFINFIILFPLSSYFPYLLLFVLSPSLLLSLIISLLLLQVPVDAVHVNTLTRLVNYLSVMNIAQWRLLNDGSKTTLHNSQPLVIQTASGHQTNQWHIAADSFTPHFNPPPLQREIACGLYTARTEGTIYMQKGFEYISLVG